MTDKRKKATANAKLRGDAAKKWLSENKLTSETKPEFDRLMKSVTK